MKLILLTLLGLIVVAVCQNNPSNPENWHEPAKAGQCPPLIPFSNQGPIQIKDGNDDKNNTAGMANNFLFPFNHFHRVMYFFPFPRYHGNYPPRRPDCIVQCNYDSDCKGTLKCCGSGCNSQCIEPLQYVAPCGLIPTDAYCNEICKKKEECMRNPVFGCGNYAGYCRSFCQSNDMCNRFRNRRCCRNLRCSFVCV